MVNNNAMWTLYVFITGLFIFGVELKEIHGLQQFANFALKSIETIL